MVEGYKYSKAMKAKGAEGLMWTEENLDAYLLKPKAFVPKTKMAFPGVKKPEDRANVIAYIKSKAKAE
jgi:cytochrome c